MTFTERGSRSEYDEELQDLPASERKDSAQGSLLPLKSYVWKKQGFVTGFGKQSCVVIGASVIWFLRKKQACVELEYETDLSSKKD